MKKIILMCLFGLMFSDGNDALKIKDLNISDSLYFNFTSAELEEKYSVSGNTIRLGSLMMNFNLKDRKSGQFIFLDGTIIVKNDSVEIMNVVPTDALGGGYAYIINDPFKSWKNYDFRPYLKGDSYIKFFSTTSGTSSHISYIPRASDFKPFSFFNERKTTIGIIFGGSGSRGGTAYLYLIDIYSGEYLLKTLDYGAYPIWTEEEKLKFYFPNNE